MSLENYLRRFAPWLVLVLLVGSFAVFEVWMNKNNEQTTEGHQADLPKPPVIPPKYDRTKKATMAPGRVIEMQTNKGRIDIMLFEKDCPLTTRQIADLAAGGGYNGVKFTRVEDNLIQTEMAKKKVPTLISEVPQGMQNAKGAVGMARGRDYNSATSSFYILLEPKPHLNNEYCVFGRLIRGMDVAMKIKKNDFIRTARVRPSTPPDIAEFNHVLSLEEERKTE